MPDPPHNAHFQFDFLVSFSTLRNFFNGQYPQNWYWNPCWTYILLKEGVQPGELENYFPAFIQKYFPEFIRAEARMALQPLTDIHLTSDLEFELEPNSSEENIYVFTVIGGFILFIASMNFMNLSTARSAKRAEGGWTAENTGWRTETIDLSVPDRVTDHLIGSYPTGNCAGRCRSFVL